MGVQKVTASDSENAVVTSADIQVMYEKLYKFLMEFLWEFRVVQSLANLEIAIFKKFPDKEEMQNCLRALKRDIAYTYNELSEDDQPEFKEAMEDLEEAIDNFDSQGCELYSVEEIVDDPVEAAEDMDSDIPDETGKHKFKFGNIKKITKEERELQEEAARTLSNPFEEEEE